MMTWELPEKYETNGGTVRWARWGRGNPLVLMHGTPFSSVVWRNIAPELAKHHEVFVWDMLGYGQSDMGEGQDVSLRAQTEIFTSLLEHWGLESPSLVAHDYGGTIALRALLLRGAQYERLVLTDPVALAPWGSSFLRLVAEHSEVFTQLPADLHAALVREYVASASEPGLNEQAAADLVRPWLSEQGQAAFYRQIAQADQYYTDEIEHRYSEIEIPVLVCWGEHDQWVPVSKGYELAALLGNASFRSLPGSGHLVQEDAPELLLHELQPFLTRPADGRVLKG